MARNYKKKGIHTSYDTAGRKNMTAEVLRAMPKSEISKDVTIGIMQHGRSSGYKGGWTDEQLAESIAEFFDFCAENDFRPQLPALRVWLHISTETITTWKKDKGKYGGKSDIIKEAYDIIEMHWQKNLDKHPTGSIFLLKTSHGHVEQSKVDITSDGKAMNNASDVRDAVSRLGLDK